MCVSDKKKWNLQINCDNNNNDTENNKKEVALFK